MLYFDENDTNDGYNLQLSEIEEIASVSLPKWKVLILMTVDKLIVILTKLLNEKLGFPYRWNCKGKNYDLVNGKLRKKVFH